MSIYRKIDKFIVLSLLIFFAFPQNVGNATGDVSLPDAGGSGIGGLQNLLLIETEANLKFTIESAAEIALENNHEIERLEFELDSALAGLAGARSLYMPSLDLNLTSFSTGPETAIEFEIPGVFQFEKEITTTDIINSGSLTLTQPVYMFGSIALANEIARLNVEQATLQLERMKETVKRDVEEAYLNAALAQEMVVIAQGAVETSGERLRIANARFEAGDAAMFDVLRSEVSLATAQEELLRAETTAELAISALTQKIGLEPGMEIEITTPDIAECKFAAPDLNLAEAREMALATRRDFLALEMMVGILDKTADLERNRPSLVLQGNYSYADTTTGFSTNHDSWGVFLNLSYNLFDGGRAESAVDEVQANRDALNARLTETRTLIGLEVESTYLEIINAKQRIEVTNTTLTSAREALRMAELGYSEGVVTYIDYLDTDLGLRQAETLHIQAVYAYMIANAKFRAAIGESEIDLPDGELK